MKLLRKFNFMERITSLSFAFGLGALWGCKEYVPVTTFEEPEDPVAMSHSARLDWAKASHELHAGWGTIDQNYSRSIIPEVITVEKMQLSAWKGERVSAQLLLWSPDSLDGVNCVVSDFKSKEAQLSAKIARTRFVRYTLSNSRTKNPVVLAADMLDSIDRFDIAAKTVRPVWLTLEVPADAQPGIYKAEVEIRHQKRKSISLPLSLTISNHELPAADKWQFHLDLWQHPAAVARVRGVELWSDAHFDALRETMGTLAKAGQKVITATLNKDPWNHQCYDAYEDMIRWTKTKDGSWKYDYQVFDRWVELMMSLGINKMINCYSMLPWNEELHYTDETSGQLVTVKAELGTPVFEEMWKPFLLDFKQHLASKGWLNITNIAMDERAPEEMDVAVRLLEECAPEMGFAIADNHQSYRRYSSIRDVCVIQDQKAQHEDIVKRREQGFNTTFYVCCGPAFPNTFTCSHPYEAELLGWYAVAADYDGMLRWAYNSWPADPCTDARFGNWTSGDTYLVYPYNRSSIRLERLIDGIEVYEKIHLLREQGVDMKGMDRLFEELHEMNINDGSLPWRDWMERANRMLNSL